MKKKIHSTHVENIKHILKRAFIQSSSKAVGIDEHLNCDAIQITTNETIKLSQLAEVADYIGDLFPNTYTLSFKRSAMGITVIVHPVEN